MPKMTKENLRSEILCACTERAETDMVLLPTQQAEVRGRLVSFRLSTARNDKVKTPAENEPQR